GIGVADAGGGPLQPARLRREDRRRLALFQRLDARVDVARLDPDLGSDLLQLVAREVIELLRLQPARERDDAPRGFRVELAVAGFRGILIRHRGLPGSRAGAEPGSRIRSPAARRLLLSRIAQGERIAPANQMMRA